MYGWLVKKVGSALALLITVVLVLLLIFAFYHGVKRFFTKGLETQIKVEQSQTKAFGSSAKEAVGTIGNRQETEAAGAANVQEAQHAIENATDVHSATDAGLDGLHRVRGRPADRPGR